LPNNAPIGRAPKRGARRSRAARNHLEQKKGALPFEGALTELGVGAVENGKARLNDSAPLAAMRKAMMR
jgi:hypothetical protein